MVKDTISNLIWEKVKFILGFTILVTLATLLFSVLQPVKYLSRVRLLAIQQYGFGVDPYNIAKATEYFSDLLTEVISSKTFFDEVLKDKQVDKNFFDLKPQKRERRWRKTVAARTIGDTGIIVISVYHPDRLQAESLASAVAFVLTTKGSLFHGAGERLSIRVIDEPITSEKPVQPKILLNVVVGLLVGLFFSIGITFFFSIEGVRIAFKVKEEDVFLK